VQYHKILCILILAIWSTSLLQFTFVLTAFRRQRYKAWAYVDSSGRNVATGWCHAGVFAIVIAILLQDLPFLVLRLVLIFNFNVASYTNMFFTAKNSVVIALMVYRLVVLFMERQKHIKREVSVNSFDMMSISKKSIPTGPVPNVFRQTSIKRNRLLDQYGCKYEHRDFDNVDNIALYNDFSTGYHEHLQTVESKCAEASSVKTRSFKAKGERHKYGRAFHFVRE